MVTLLRVAALLLLFAGIIIAIEGLPQRADTATHARTIVQCLTQNLTVIEVPQTEAEGGDIGPPPPAACGPYLIGLNTAAGAVLASLLFGGLGSLIYNVRRSRLIMERFDDTSQGSR